MMNEGHITLKDIAKKLNISISTVSRALRGLPDVKPETKAEILKLAKDMDYQKNFFASSLQTRKSFTVGVIIPQIAHLFFAKIISGIQEVAFGAGYRVIISQSNESYHRETVDTDLLLSSRVDGLLVAPSTETSNCQHFEKIHKKGIPLVFFDRICESIKASVVVVDDFEGAFNGVEHLIEQGCRKIAHLAGPETLSVGKERKRGYIAALKKYNLPVQEEYILNSNLNQAQSFECTNQLMDLPDPPDAIFGVTDTVIIGALLALKQRNISIPGTVALLGFTNDPVTELVEPSLSSVSQPPLEIGRVAAQLFLNQVNNKSGYFFPETRVLKTKLVVRESSQKKKYHQKADPKSIN